MIKLSVCILTKDNEDTIERTLASVKDFADEIVILDSGSKDKTISIAKSYNCKIYNYSWEDDFSKARNTCISYATFDWILILDSDEEFINKVDIKKEVEENSYTAYALEIISYEDSLKTNVNCQIRLFRNNQGYFYINPIHESIDNSIKTISGIESIGGINCRINHYGYDLDNSSKLRKIDRNLRIINKYVKEEETAYGYYLLGNILTSMENYEEANKAYKKAIDLGIEKEDYNISFKENYISFLVTINLYSEALDIIDKTLKIFPDFRDMYFFRSLCLNALGYPYEALDSLMIFNRLESKPLIYPSFELEEKYKTKEIERRILGF